MQQRKSARGRSAQQFFSLDRKFLLVTLAMAAIILHGSLYPYDFHIPLGGPGPLTTLLRSWHTPPSSLGELIANILLYVPLGFFAALTLRTRRRLLVTTLLGLALCTSVELTQYYDASRVTCLSDVCLNTFGTWLGAMAAVVIRAPSLSPIFKKTLLQPVPIVLLIIMLGYCLYPYVPTIDLHKYWNSLKPLVLHPVMSGSGAFRYFALWLTICFLASNAVGGARSGFFILCLAGFVFAAKVLIVGQSVFLAETIGAIGAILLWLAVLGRMSWAAGIVGIILCAMIIVSRLEPFAFQPNAGSFGWLPFRGFLQGSFGINVQSLFQKAFLYGSLIWIASRAGLRLRIATWVVAALVLATSFMETFLPGRSAEITDALIALLMGIIFTAMDPKERARRERFKMPSPAPRS